MVPKYIAKKRQLVGDRQVNPGEEVPEAAHWPNLRSYINTGFIEVHPDPPPPAHCPHCGKHPHEPRAEEAIDELAAASAPVETGQKHRKKAALA